MSALDDAARVGRLGRMRLVATGLLVLMAAIYVAAGFWLRQAPWLGLVRAFTEAATVGACADWFAVTALFRRPLGLPIPHTGIIPRNKDRIGEALGGFIADNFLTQEILEAKLQRLEVGRWGAAWLRQPRNAEAAAERLVALIPELLDLATPDARRRFVGALAADLVELVPAASTAAGVLRAVWGGERSAAILDAGLDLVATALAQNDDLIRAEVAGRTYKWLPKWLDRAIADRILNGLAQTLVQMREPDHPWRGRVHAFVDDFIARLETDPVLAARAEAIKRQIAANPLLLERLGDFAGVIETRLRPATDEDAHLLVLQVAGWLAGLGAWLYDEADAIEIFNAWVRLAIQRTIAPRRHQIGRAIASVVAGWDARGVAEKLELQVGADLQYIRINGTLVGGLVGLAIYALSRSFGL
ncbi:MAG TPA: DUF445 domain-containing protein [Caulobacteraceae bacterium]|nr:DUF445 domain-containing protein [Caulobacteraceae bacterium]